MSLVIVRSLGAALVCASVTAGCAGTPAPSEAPSVPTVAPAQHDDSIVRIPEASKSFVGVDAVGDETGGPAVTAPAHLEFRDGAVSQVGAPLDGRVVTVHVTVGQHVKTGDPLVTLDCPDASALRTARAVASANVREARLELERQRRMQQEGVGIERDVVAAETRLSAADAEAARVEVGLSSIGSGPGSSVVVRAPISGVVTARKASAGLTVQHGSDPLVEIGDASAIWVVADVFERDLPRVRAGAPAHVTLQTLDEVLEGRVATIGPVVRSEMRTAPVYITVESRSGALRPGEFGRATIDAPTTGLTLPVSAVLIKDGKDPIVYVQRDPLTFVRRRVVVAQSAEGRVHVISGLTAGERVVVRGALLLDGASDELF